jgi:hypothetical protein
MADSYSLLPAGQYRFDMIGHSRGSLLAPSLVELDTHHMGTLLKQPWKAADGVKLKVDRIIFVGTPNARNRLVRP